MTGVFGSLGIADNNFRGRNQRVSLNGIVGSGVILNDASIQRRMNMQFELSFFEPHFLNADTSLMSKLFFRDFGVIRFRSLLKEDLAEKQPLLTDLRKTKTLHQLSLSVLNILT